MITWILGGILLVLILAKRFSKDGKIEGEPFGMPRGTVRALITIMIVAFPFGYLFTEKPIPGLIVNVIFIVVAFYFEARRGEQEKLIQIVKELKGSDLKLDDADDQRMPLYLPKYTVRSLLIVLIVIFITLNWLGPKVPFEQTNTLVDLLIIIGFFIIGVIFRAIKKVREKKDIKIQLKTMDASLSDAEIIKNLMSRKTSWYHRIGKSIVSIFMLIAVITALISYTISFDYLIIRIQTYDLTLVTLLLLLVNAYFGFRE
ncbi:MAG: hypothetical protein ACFFBI_06015 [Promethearchaeota archaeon]